MVTTATRMLSSWPLQLARLLALAVLLSSELHTGSAHAAAAGDRALEHRVKAAFLYRFTEFVEWPDTAFARTESPFVIVVAGHDGVAGELALATAERRIAGRPIEIRRVVEPDAPVPACQIVFVGAAERARLGQWLRAAPRHALIVTEHEGALSQGSVINFVVDEGRVRFDISLESAERRSLRLSSRLLAVARVVRGVP